MSFSAQPAHARRNYRPSAAAGATVLLALANERTPLVQPGRRNGRPALLLADALRVTQRADGMLAVERRELGIWRPDPETESLPLIAPSQLIDAAVTCAVRECIRSATADGPLETQDRLYVERRLRAEGTVRLVRANAKEWGVNESRIGVLGFSAGGETAGLAAINHKSELYKAVDKIDETSARPDFAVLVYPAYFTDKKNRLKETVTITKETPPMFLAHSFDDPVDVRSSLLLALGLKDAGVACELHTYATGGHGWGMRQTGHPCNTWPARCGEWMDKQGWLKK